MSGIRAAAGQMQHAPGDKESNPAKIEGFVLEAASAGLERLAFPEMCSSGRRGEGFR